MSSPPQPAPDARRLAALEQLGVELFVRRGGPLDVAASTAAVEAPQPQATQDTPAAAARGTRPAAPPAGDGAALARGRGADSARALLDSLGGSPAAAPPAAAGKPQPQTGADDPVAAAPGGTPAAPSAEAAAIPAAQPAVHCELLAAWCGDLLVVRPADLPGSVRRVLMDLAVVLGGAASASGEVLRFNWPPADTPGVGAGVDQASTALGAFLDRQCRARARSSARVCGMLLCGPMAGWLGAADAPATVLTRHRLPVLCLPGAEALVQAAVKRQVWARVQADWPAAG